MVIDQVRCLLPDRMLVACRHVKLRFVVAGDLVWLAWGLVNCTAWITIGGDKKAALFSKVGRVVVVLYHLFELIITFCVIQF